MDTNEIETLLTPVKAAITDMLARVPQDEDGDNEIEVLCALTDWIESPVGP